MKSFEYTGNSVRDPNPIYSRREVRDDVDDDEPDEAGPSEGRSSSINKR